MKKIKISIIVSAFGLIALSSCNGALDETVYSALSDDYLSSSEAKYKVLLSAYGNANQRSNPYFYTSGMVSGETWTENGSIQAYLTPLVNFNWTSSHDYFSSLWQSFYAAIRDANIVIANTSNSNDATDLQYLAEARFVRAYSYAYLHDWFGGLPLYQSPDDEAYLEKSSSEETVAFIESELLAAAEVLPVKQVTYGRATKGAALGILSWLYLNDKQWDKAAETAKKVIDLKVYDLFPDYTQLFKIENEGNQELIWVNQANNSAGIAFPANILPTDYPHLSNQTIWASRVHLYDDFVNSFADGDLRKSLIATSYISSTTGKEVKLLGTNESYPYKYELDPNAIGSSFGNDIPVLRYADILLIRAEALNESQGVNVESVDLLNRIRTRAGVSTYNQSDFTKESFRTALFQERSWEFFFEQKSRSDQVRQGTFITNAISRGLTYAKSYQVLFPIPQKELDANPKLKQNPGYESAVE